MKNTNKGFTLIELLAVIVILAIIALIATPVVLGIIEKAKLRTVEISGLNYVDAIDKQIVSNMLEVDGQIKDGFYDYDEIPVSIKGQTPNSGWFKIEKGQVSDYSIVIDGYVVTKGSKIKKGDTVADKAYTLGQIVYFDPVSTDKCDENSTSETCYKWRVIETADTKSKPTITLQMDHNLINTVAWVLTDSCYAELTFSKSNVNAVQMGLPRAKQMDMVPCINKLGPVTALTELNEKTKTWLRVEPLTYEYDTSAATNNYGKMSCTNGNCTLNGNVVEGTARARMITGEEVSDITNTEVTDPNVLSKTWTLASSWEDLFYFSNIDYKLGTQDEGEGNTNLAWLIENTRDIDESGATSNGIENGGYWTLSPVSDDRGQAWVVDNYGLIAKAHIVYDDGIYGVRPVITILKSEI